MDFDQIYQDYFPDVFHYVCGLAGDRNIAEEVTQDSFVKAMKHIDRFDGQKDIRAWLFTIAKNTYLSHCRKHNRLTSAEELQEPLTGVCFVDALLDQEQAFLIHQFLHSMAEPYKEVFTLRVFGELPYHKIGALFGKSDSWARVTFYRAKEKIIQYMKEVEHEGNHL